MRVGRCRSIAGGLLAKAAGAGNPAKIGSGRHFRKPPGIAERAPAAPKRPPRRRIGRLDAVGARL
jgi:hypothetical protein